MKFADVFIAIVVIAIIMLIIIPLNSIVLDMLLTINLALSIVILLTTLYIKEPLEFSIFPSLLLLATLFRLALNISSTRLILGEGYAGAVIETFGNFVIKGNVAVGFIIFLIIVIVQFIVITKGSERVAEVAARFTLDAMPGKQMAIDADLNAGLVDEQTARIRREKIQREADFYGAMDGASKFIKGDAIVGIIISIINIIGGIIVGYKDMSISEAIETYATMTVGDGLVSQIPALIISTASGIIVTRAASDSSLGEDFITQTTNQPIALLIAALFLLMMSFFPGFPTAILLAFSAGFGFLGYKLYSEQKNIETVEDMPIEQEVEDMRSPENVIDLLHVDPLELEFGYGIIPLVDVEQGGDLLDRVVMIRRQIALDLGFIVPVVRLRDNIQLEPNEYIIKIKGVEVARGKVLPDHYLAMDSGVASGDIEGIDAIEPAFGLPAKWIREEQKDEAEMLGYTVVDASSVIATHLTEIIKQNGHELLGRQEVQALLDNLKETHPTLVEEVVPKLLTLGDIQKVLRNLIQENVPIRDMVTIMETLADYSIMTKDTDILTEHVRQSLSRTITNRFIPERKAKVITIAPELEQKIIDNVKQTEFGSYLSLEPDIVQTIYNNLSREVEEFLKLGMQPIVVTAPIVRIYFKRLTERLFPQLVVLSYNELEDDVEIQSVGIVRG
ncbi:MAG TPA: flagellar biosynthesis protein FlhA [Clostridiales bacterium]|nr:flagellar biosynthesis protein FlhA [Clostridiales bacterium]